MSNKIGFIGCGKMGSAIVKGILASKVITSKDLIISEVNPEITNKISQELGVKTICDNKTLAKNSDVIFIATKPNFVETVLNEIKEELNEKKLIVSIAAGVSTKKIEAIATKSPVIRVMPNTPALVLEGMSATAKGFRATDEQETFVMNLLSSIGKCISVKEEQIDIVTAISGSGPAFFYAIFNEIAKAGEKLGLDYKKSLLLATQTAIGSAKMVINGEKHPEELIRNVATKGGCTEVGVSFMKKSDTEKLFFELIQKTAQKAHELG